MGDEGMRIWSLESGGRPGGDADGRLQLANFSWSLRLSLVPRRALIPFSPAFFFAFRFFPFF